MKITDIIALAKQGYKPADIKELLTLAEPEKDPEPKKEKDPEPEKDQEKEKDPEPEKDPEKEKDPEPEEVKKLKGEITDLTARLEKLQEANTKKDTGGNSQEDPLEIFNKAYQNLF